MAVEWQQNVLQNGCEMVCRRAAVKWQQNRCGMAVEWQYYSTFYCHSTAILQPFHSYCLSTAAFLQTISQPFYSTFYCHSAAILLTSSAFLNHVEQAVQYHFTTILQHILVPFYSHSTAILQPFYCCSSTNHLTPFCSTFYCHSTAILQAFYRHSTAILQPFYSHSTASLLQTISQPFYSTFYCHSTAILLPSSAFLQPC